MDKKLGKIYFLNLSQKIAIDKALIWYKKQWAVINRKRDTSG